MDTSPADLRAILDGADGSNGFGGGTLLLIILFLLSFGMGGFGFGGRGAATDSLNTDFAILERKMDGLTNGQCQAGYENARLANETQVAMLTGFGQTQMAMQQGFAQQAQCCCEIQRAIDQVNYLAQQNKCDIITAVHQEGETTRAMIQQNKIDTLQQQLNEQNQQIQTMKMQDSIAQATCGMVKYPQSIAYTAGPSPFFGGCGCQTACGCNTCI